MKQKILLLLLLLTSLIGYTKWGDHQHAYLFQLEADIVKKIFTSPRDILHPLILLPFIGQIILLYSLLKKGTSKWLIGAGVTFLGILLLMLLLIGILSKDIKIICCALPYIILSIYFFSMKKNV